MRLIALAAAVWIAATASAQDAPLSALRATLTTLHSYSADTALEKIGAIPELATAKHQLRDWIEGQLDAVKEQGQEKNLADHINGVLRPVRVEPVGNDQNYLGSLGGVDISFESGMLILTTRLGIICQYDESAYGYMLVDAHWKRVWESEQTAAKYAPQSIIAVNVWRGYKDGHQDGPAFVMTLGNEWGCISVWHPVYYRIWRIDSESTKLLIDESDFAYLRGGGFVRGSIVRDRTKENAPVDALVEYATRSIDAFVHNREVVRHYLIDGDHVRRVDPVALSPRDFVDEWLTRGWDESAMWSVSKALQLWHRKLHADFVAGMFAEPTKSCRTPGLWQVTVAPGNAEKNFEPEPNVYFLVRWLPPFHFTMMAVSAKPRPGCTQEDPEADEWRTLFNTQDWRR